MNEKELGKALLQGQETLDVAELTRRVLRRDRRRVWLLGAACVLAWMLVVALPWATILPMLAKIVQHQAQLAGQPAPDPATARHESILLLQAIKIGTMATLFGSLASMLVAALCTVSLILVSRRATLRQVNARLGEISEQLKGLATKPSP